MCGSGGVTGRPGDPGDGASSKLGPAQILREPGARPASPRVVRSACASGKRQRAPAAAGTLQLGEQSLVCPAGVKMQTPRWRAGEGVPGQVPEGRAGQGGSREAVRPALGGRLGEPGVW